MDSTPESSEPLLRLHGQGGVHTELRVARHAPGKHSRATAPDVMGVMAKLAKVYRDLTMAALLNRLGSRTGTGKTWRAHSVAGGRYHYRLPHFAKGPDGLTLKQAAPQLGVSATVVKRCIAQGLLPARRVVPQAPWIIQRTDLDRGAVQAEVQRVRSGRRPLGPLSDQRESPGQAARQAGDAQVSSSPAEVRSATLRAGEQ
jgi:hypothetical protein